MHLTPEEKAKADPLLQEILDDSLPDEILQVVMVLDEDKAKLSVTETLKPSQFASRVEYRKALIEKRNNQLKIGTVGETIEALKKLDLTIHGGKVSRFLVLEGTAEKIVESLSLSGVKSATLDQIIRIEPTPIDTKIVEYFSNLILEIFSNLILEIYRNSILEMFLLPDDKDKIFQGAKQYISNYYKNYGNLKVLGMPNYTSLEDIYTTVKVLPENLIRQFSDFEEMKDIFKKRERFSYEKEYKKLTGIDVANHYRFLTVLGAPGSGKSTLLRKIGIDYLKGTLKHECIPIFIDLKQFNNLQYINLFSTIKTIFTDCEFPNTDQLINVDQLINQGLKKGKFIFLLDGLDEVSNNNLDNMVKEVRNLVENNNKNRFIISCRTAAYQQQFKQFKNVIISEFDDIQIQEFINNWFSSEIDQRAETAKKCLEALEGNIGAKELAKTPLLLTFICLVYDESQTLPKNRSDLYKRALEILLEKWSAEKRLERDPIYKDFTTKSEIMLLSEIAYEGFVEDKLFFETQELVDKIKTFLSRKLNAPQDLDGEAVLNAIAIQQGILIERLDNIYSFSHLTLQEYLTAKYIVDNGLITKTINNYVTDTRWKEVFILIAGFMEGNRGADQLLIDMENKAISYLKSLSDNHRFLQLLKWAETKTTTFRAKLTFVVERVVANAKSNPYTYSNAYAKAYANAYVYLNAYADAYAHHNADAYSNDYAYANANVYAYTKDNTYTNAYAIKYFIRSIDKMEAGLPLFSSVNLEKLREKLEEMKTKIPDKDQHRTVHQQFAKQLLETWLNAFDITLDMINLSITELEEIDQNYFYVYNLILQCKDAAELVTKETWEKIEERMYRVPN